MSAGPREQTTEPARDKIAQAVRDAVKFKSVIERQCVGDNADAITAAVVEALGLTEEWTWSWPENLTGTGEPGYGFSVDTEQEARAEADSWMSIVRRWVSGWSVVGGEPSE